MKRIKKFFCPLWANATHTRNIIRRVPNQREVITNLRRFHAIFFNARRFVYLLFFHRVVNHHLSIINKLIQVFVVGHNTHFHVILFSKSNRRSNHIVRLIPFHRALAKTHFLNPLNGNRKLGQQILRGCRTVGFVVWVNGIAKGFSLGIQRKKNIIRSMLCFKAVDKIGKSREQSRGKSLRVREVRQGKVVSKKKSKCINNC